MDPGSLASTAVTMLTPYLQRLAGQALDSTADEVAGVLPALLRRLHDALRGRLPAGTYAGNQLAGLEEHPERRGRQQALVSALAELLEGDEEFAKELLRLVEPTDVTSPQAYIAKVEGPVAIGGDVHQEGTYVAGHTLNVQPKEPSS